MAAQQKESVDTAYCILKQASVPGLCCWVSLTGYAERHHLEVLTSFSLALWSLFTAEYKAGYSLHHSFLKCEVNV